MKLTKFTDYSLRVLMYMAVQTGRRATIAQISKAFGVSEHHLVKVVHHLGKSGWLAGVRGNGGGLELARAPAQINIAEVVRSAEGAAVAECLGDGENHCAIGPWCGLRGVLGEAMAAFYAVLARYTLADLVLNREQLATILFAPPAHTAGPRETAVA
jgi:Rrf2 family transcriptional regulator, nitric oxide-sensitive transcriptional repressor